jgi:hypothetical protein
MSISRRDNSRSARARRSSPNFIAIALVTAGLVTPLNTLGAGPTIFRDVLDDTFVDGYCGFPVEVHTSGTGVFHLWEDPNGALERLIITSANIKLTFTNLITGQSVWTPSVNMTEISVHDDGTATQSYRGLLWHLVVPGEGLLTADVGRIDFLYSFVNGTPVFQGVVFAAGIQENEFLALVCTVLAAV